MMLIHARLVFAHACELNPTGGAQVQRASGVP
jgi:hypothetical protein